MSHERELITLAIGNYSSLVAAQWANTTSHYDVHHSTLYSECHTDHGQQQRQVRAPRLLIFDAPYASVFDDIYEMEQKLKSSGAGSSDDDEEEVEQQRGAAAVKNGYYDPSYTSLLWSGSKAAPLDEEGRRIDKLANRLRRRVWRHGLPTDGDAEEDEEEEEEEENRSGAPGREADAVRQSRRYKRRLFATGSTTTPWWQFIHTGVRDRAVTTLRPLHSIDGAGDIPALHSFGYGLANLKDTNPDVETYTDALRKEVEAADHPQGLQCFSDGDGLFGGAAVNVLEDFWESVGSKMPVVNWCSFSPLPQLFSDPELRATTPFVARRHEEAALNELLATLRLSEKRSAVYVPLRLSQWGELFKGKFSSTGPPEPPAWLQHDNCTAQYIAAVADTALYGLRDGGEANEAAYFLDHWCHVVRPSPSLRVAALMAALPLPVQGCADLSIFLQQNRLLPDAPLDEEVAKGREESTSQDDVSTARRAGYVPLSHSMSLYSPQQEAGRVLGHSVVLRGAGILPSNVYPAGEAMLRYALPLRTSTYLPLLTTTNCPTSSSFPSDLILPNLPVETPLTDLMQGVDVGAHVLSTYATAPMLREIVTKAHAILQQKMDTYCDAYAMEKDEWREAVEEGTALFDTYHHAAPSDDEEDSDY